MPPINIDPRALKIHIEFNDSEKQRYAYILWEHAGKPPHNIIDPTYFYFLAERMLEQAIYNTILRVELQTADHEINYFDSVPQIVANKLEDLNEI